MIRSRKIRRLDHNGASAGRIPVSCYVLFVLTNDS